MTEEPTAGNSAASDPAASDPAPSDAATRSGFVAIAGRPNVGKSTLVNMIVGAKVAVISDKPQTTRRAIRGVATGEREDGAYQLVLVDLPGVQRPRDVLTERMQHQVERQLVECDAVLLLLNGAEEIGAGDRFIARLLMSSSVPVVVAVNKLDLLSPGETADALFHAARLEDAGLHLHGVFPISALTGAGVDPLVDALVSLLPNGPLLYPRGTVTDQPRNVLIAELIREQALVRTREEIPHAIEVQVEDVSKRDDLTDVRAVLWVETPSQKGILIGKEGRMVRDIGSAARRELERELGGQFFLGLTVKVRKGWRSDEGLLDRLGIEG